MMRSFRPHLILFLILFVFISTAGVAQKDVRIKRSEFEIENRGGFKVAWKNIRQGDKFYDKGIDYFDKALEEYQRAYRYNQEYPPLNYKMGVCYLAVRNNKQAIEFFNKVLGTEKTVAADIFYLLARAYHLDYQFEHAIRNYQKCLEADIIKELDKTKNEINVMIRQCNNGIDLVKDPIRTSIKNLGKNINSEYDEYGAVVHPNDSTLYFTTRRKHEDNKKRWIGDNKYYSDIFVSQKKNGQWQKAKLVPKDLYSKDNDAVLDITTDPERIYIYLGDKDNGDIYYYEKKNGNWRGPKSFDGAINTDYKETSVSFTNDKRTIFFVSNIEEETIGKKDIFTSDLNNKDRWTQPKNLGGLVNSRLNEEGVFINSTEDKLYFSSKGHNSMGGYDIFYAERDVDGNWKEPVNIGYPINTPYDDVLFRPMRDSEKKAYYSSIRDDSYGRKDIYEVIFLGEAKDMLFMEAMEPISWNVHPDTTLLYSIPEKLAIDTTLYMVGHVRDSNINKGIKAKMQVIDNDENKIISTYITDSLGQFTVKLPEKKKYGVEVTARDYLFFADNIDLNQMEIKNDTVYKDFYLDKVEIGKKVVLENIYFETSSDKLKSESYAELGRVVKLLRNNPSIKMEISGHTDNVGSYLTNKKLSKARAKSVVEYLVSKGISKDRLKYKGYSFTQPIAPNDTPEGRQKNRRVEFEILEK